MLDRPRIIYPSSVFFVHRIFNRLANANEGRVPDISLLNIHIVKALEADPSLFNLPFIARKLRKDWEKANHKIISARTGEVVFVPSAAITVAPRIRVRMDSLSFEDLIAWGESEQKARTNYERTMNGRIAYRNLRLTELVTILNCRRSEMLSAHCMTTFPPKQPRRHSPRLNVRVKTSVKVKTSTTSEACSRTRFAGAVRRPGLARLGRSSARNSLRARGAARPHRRRVDQQRRDLDRHCCDEFHRLGDDRRPERRRGQGRQSAGYPRSAPA